MEIKLYLKSTSATVAFECLLMWVLSLKMYFYSYFLYKSCLEFKSVLTTLATILRLRLGPGCAFCPTKKKKSPLYSPAAVIHHEY